MQKHSLKQRAIMAIERLREMETHQYGQKHGGFARPNQIRKQYDMSVPICQFIKDGYCTPTKDCEHLIAELELALGVCPDCDGTGRANRAKGRCTTCHEPQPNHDTMTGEPMNTDEMRNNSLSNPV